MNRMFDPHALAKKKLSTTNNGCFSRICQYCQTPMYEGMEILLLLSMTMLILMIMMVMTDDEADKYDMIRYFTSYNHAEPQRCPVSLSGTV